MVAHHQHGRRRRRVVFGGDQAAAERVHAKRDEIVAGHVLGAQRPGGRFHSFAANAHRAAAGLKGGEVLELGGVLFETLVEREREHAPTILRSAFHAAVVAVANAIQPRWIRHGQRSQHHRVNEREDRGCAANPDRQRQHGGCGEDGRSPELAQRVDGIVQQVRHVTSRPANCGAKLPTEPRRPPA
jgi:hypothetical protein